MTEFDPEETGIVDFAVREHRSLWLDGWHRLIASNTARLGMFIVVIFVMSAVLAHYFWKYDPAVDLDYSLKLKPPTLLATETDPSAHFFGTDKLGRDIFRRVVHGGWNSLRVGIVAVSISLLIGGILGLLAGFYESIEITYWERVVLMGGIGFALGSLSAWIAVQLFQVLFFTGLGVASAMTQNWMVGKPVRLLV